MGINKLKTFIPDICTQAGLEVHYTNHSLRATAVTRMYNRGVPKNLIAEKSGHKSLKALRAHERTSEDQEISAGHNIQVVVDEENRTPASVHDCSNGETLLPSGPSCTKPGVGPLQQFSGLSNCTFNFY